MCVLLLLLFSLLKTFLLEQMSRKRPIDGVLN